MDGSKSKCKATKHKQKLVEGTSVPSRKLKFSASKHMEDIKTTTKSTEMAIVNFVKQPLGYALGHLALYQSATEEGQRLQQDMQNAQKELHTGRNAIDIDRLHILTLDFNVNKYNNIRRMCRFAIIATIFTTMTLYLSAMQMIGTSVGVTIVCVWWFAVLLLVLHSSARYSIRYKSDWNRVTWDVVVPSQAGT